MLVNVINFQHIANSGLQANNNNNKCAIQKSKLSFCGAKDKFVMKNAGSIISDLIQKMDSEMPEGAIKLIKAIGRNSDKQVQRQIALFAADGKTITDIALAKGQPQVANCFIGFVSGLNPKTKREFALLVNNYGQTQLDVALINKQPKTARAFLNLLKELDKKTIGKVILHEDPEEMHSAFDIALSTGQKDLADEIFETVKTLDNSMQNKFIFHLSEYGFSNFNMAAYYDPKGADKFLAYVKTLDPKMQRKFALFTDPVGKNSQFVKTLFNKRPEAAKTFLNFTKGLDQKTQNDFALLANNSGITQLHYALSEKQPDVAIEFLEFVKGLDIDTQKKFVNLVEGCSSKKFDGIFHSDYPDVAAKFKRFAATTKQAA